MGKTTGPDYLETGTVNEYEGANDPVLETKVEGDAFPRLRVAADGTILTGAGTADPDTAVGGGSGGSGLSWETVTFPLDHTLWDEANKVGTWVFNVDGSISQTDNTQTAAGLCTLKTDYNFAIAAVQFEMRVDAVDGASAAGGQVLLGSNTADTASYGCDRQAGGGTDSGQAPTAQALSVVPIGGGTPTLRSAYTLDISGGFHTFMFALGAGYLDGVFHGIGSGSPSALDDYAIALKADGAVTFRNVKILHVLAPVFA